MIINKTAEKKDQVFIQKITLVGVKKVKTILKLIGDKGGNMVITTLDLFNTMTDKDFIYLHDLGKLKHLCLQLSLDLELSKNKKISDA
mgnify:FL=1